MVVKKSLGLLLLIALLGCGEKEAKEDKAKQAVKEVITREFQYYEGAKQKLKETEKQEEQRRAQEKDLE
jgi:hypothetical protein